MLAQAPAKKPLFILISPGTFLLHSSSDSEVRGDDAIAALET